MRLARPLQFALLFYSALATATAQERPRLPSILNVSSFMMPPRQTWAPIDGSADANVVVTEHAGDGDLGFRVLHLRASVKGTKQAAVDLARSQLVQTGDILLSFRPLWDRTLAYAHMQLGISHSAIAFVVSDGSRRFVMTIESPISYSSPLNYPGHYADLDAIHIVRPTLDEAQKRKLEKWARLIMSNRGRFVFFTDYSKPMYKRGIPGIDTPKDQIRHLAEVALGHADKFESYCSEFVWSLLGLRDCEPAAFDGACISPIFTTGDGMLTGVIPKISGDAGLAQGPEAALIGGKFANAERIAVLTGSVFVDVLTDESQLAGHMSAGHINVAKENRQNMTIINGYYAAGEPEPLAIEINKDVVGNVSPTSFLIRSNAGMDGLRYVGTIVFDR